MIRPLAVSPPRLHGHVRLELRDAKTGALKQATERDNYVTGAIEALINNVAGGSEQIGDFVMPVATKALGGLMLFDEQLGDDPAVFDFPAGSARMLGYALQDTNTTNPMRGSLISSAAIDGGWETTWEFLPSQGNGTINAACLTNAGGGSLDVINPFLGYAGTSHKLLNDSGTVLNDSSRVIYYDDARGEVYYAKDGTVTGSTFSVKIYREQLSLGAYKVGDAPNTAHTSELVQTITATFPLVSGDSIPLPTSHYDFARAFAGIDKNGLIWFVFSGTRNVNLYPDFYAYARLAFDSSLRTFSVDGTGKESILGERPHFGAAVSGGYLYLQTSTTSPEDNAPCDRLLAVNVDNLADVSGYNLPSDFVFSTASSFQEPQQAIVPCGGGLLVSVRNSNNYNYAGSYSPAKGLTLDGESYLYSDANAPAAFTRIPSRLQAWNFANTVSGAYITNYRGTVANLTTPVIKTAADTLRVIYTLTDA